MILIPLVLLIAAKTGRRADRLLLLPEGFYAGTMLLEFEVVGEKKDMAAEWENLREQLQSGLMDAGHTENVMCCAKEIVSEMRKISKYIHLKLREEENRVELFIRSIGGPWELPGSLSDRVAEWGGNDTITYSYVYKMNIVCITLAKESI